MGKIARLAVASLLLAAGACADDEATPPIDAALVDAAGCGDCDAPNDASEPDADTSDAIDAAIDAMSTVNVVQCPGNPALVIGINAMEDGYTYTPDVQTISVNDVVKFDPAGTFHNMVSGSGGNEDGQFSTPTSEVTCLRFTAAGTFPFFCNIHSFTGSITVMP
jgi:plastocyanin